MSAPLPTMPCPFVAQLVAMLLENRATPSGGAGSSMFSRLIDLEAEARRQDASENTRRLIARVRRISGTATIIPFPRRTDRAGHAARTFR